MLPWLLCAGLAAAAAVLWLRLWLLRRGLDRLGEDLAWHLAHQTNTLLSVQSRDPALRRLAARLNEQLRLLRAERQRCQNGDREVKNAVTNVAHDLRTPLTALCGYLELLKRDPTGAESERYLALVEDRALAMKQLTDELFRYAVEVSAAEALRPAPVCLNDALEESLAAFYAVLAQRGITPTLRITATRVVRRLDKAALSRVLGNILNNALKYSDGDLDVALSPQGEICIGNTAAGLDQVQVGRLFDRFFSVQETNGGTGLGLSIARSLVEQMGGRITARYAASWLSIHIVFPPDAPAP